MNWRKFFKPDRRKILVTLSFVIMTISLSFTLDNCFALTAGGRPFFCVPLYIIGGKVAYALYQVVLQIPPFRTFLETTTVFGFFLNLTDFLFYYTNACLLIWFYERGSKED